MNVHEWIASSSGIQPEFPARRALRTACSIAAFVLAFVVAGCGARNQTPLPSARNPLGEPLPVPSAPPSALPPMSAAPAGPSPFAIAQGSDGNLWFTEFRTHRIGRITTLGVAKPFELGC